MAAKPAFPTAQMALETFRRGPRGSRWEAAAEYLLEHADTDTRMLLDYAMDKTRREVEAEAKKGRRRSPYWLVLLGAAGLITTVAATAMAVYALIAYKCG